MFMSNKERKSEQEEKTLTDKKGKVNVAGGMGLLLFPEERPGAFDNFIAA